MSDDLDKQRTRIRAIDDEIMSLMAERLKVAREIGRVKLARGLPIKDFKVEKDVIERSMLKARQAGVYEDMASEAARLLIKYAVLAQDEFHAKSRATTDRDRRNILIVGGSGHMGMWLSEFFSSFGHRVTHFDPVKTKGDARFDRVESLDGATTAFDAICLATPISKTAALIDNLAKTPGRALVFDVCSLKTPIIDSFQRAEKAGLRITSIHPMFGPDVELLAGRNIIFCQSGHDEALQEARSLFEETTAHLLDIPLAEHDRLMSYVLGLSHLMNLVFARVLSTSKLSFADLQKVASTTFTAQLAVTMPVSEENQDLYYEIQSENGFTAELIASINRELGSYETAINEDDVETFKSFMATSRDWFAD